MDALLHQGHAEIIDIRSEERRDTIHAVTVGVGFDNGQDFGGRNVRADGFEILFELGKVDFKKSGTHGQSIAENKILRMDQIRLRIGRRCAIISALARSKTYGRKNVPHPQVI